MTYASIRQRQGNFVFISWYFDIYYRIVVLTKASILSRVSNQQQVDKTTPQSYVAAASIVNESQFNKELPFAYSEDPRYLGSWLTANDIAAVSVTKKYRCVTFRACTMTHHTLQLHKLSSEQSVEPMTCSKTGERQRDRSGQRERGERREAHWQADVRESEREKKKKGARHTDRQTAI